MSFKVLEITALLTFAFSLYSINATPESNGDPQGAGWSHSALKGHGHGWGNQEVKANGWESNYKFGYGVNDWQTGDVKTAYETRQKGWTKGSYSLLQPDGVFRTVNYEADPWNGFRATVHNRLHIRQRAYLDLGSVCQYVPVIDYSAFMLNRCGM